MIRINQIEMLPGYTRDELEAAILKKAELRQEELLSWEILRESLDARKHRGKETGRQIRCLLSVCADIRNEKKYLRRIHNRDIQSYEPKIYHFPYRCSSQKPAAVRPVIVGCGPAGLLCGLMLARAGYRPILLERGGPVEERMQIVDTFWKTGKLDPETNVQFGEGGAGTFSDGKLNTLVKDPHGLHALVLDEFIRAGAPPQIRYMNKPHLGTDALTSIVRNIRREIREYGGELRFHSRVSSLLTGADGALAGVVVNDEESIRTTAAVFAIGHSARDTFRMLLDAGAQMEQKPFAIGVRIEHPQAMINDAQYGGPLPDGRAADYKLTYKAMDGRSVYTFCMCPGGYVVNASSAPGMLAVNGMSYQARDGENANSAVIVSVRPDDFESTHPLAGVRFQQEWERRAFLEGQGKVPIQLFGDFRSGQVSTGFGEVQHNGRGEAVFGDLHRCLPAYVCRDLTEGIVAFGEKISGFDRPDAILSGVETRTSSPVRILRDENLQSCTIRGLFPCGEGAGYAGGITSAAMDGIRCAEAVAGFLEESDPSVRDEQFR